MTKPMLQRFEERITQGPNGCWEWTVRPNGSRYGTITTPDRKSVYAHRWSYEYHRAEIPEGLQIDHLCRNTWCVNPWHMEPVTAHVNTMRSTSPSALRAQQTHCSKGHEYTPENTYWRPERNGHPGRDCRECRRERDRKRPNGYQRSRKLVAS